MSPVALLTVFVLLTEQCEVQRSAVVCSIYCVAFIYTAYYCQLLHNAIIHIIYSVVLVQYKARLYFW